MPFGEHIEYELRDTDWYPLQRHSAQTIIIIKYDEPNKNQTAYKRNTCNKNRFA